MPAIRIVQPDIQESRDFVRYITNDRSSQSWRDLDLSLASVPNPSRENWRDLDLSIGTSRPMTEAEPPDLPQV